MKGVFASAGLNLVLRNQAMGGWDYRSGTMYCLDNIAGKDTDVLFWEWGCFGPTVCSCEVFSRNAFAMKNRPAVIFLEEFGGGKPGAMWHSLLYYRLGKHKQLFDGYMSHRGCFPGRHYVGPAEKFLDAQWYRAYMDNKTDCPQKQREGEQWYIEHTHDLEQVLPPDALASKGPLQGTFGDTHGQAYREAGFGVYRLTGAVSGKVDHLAWWTYRNSLFRVVHHAGVLGHLLMGHIVSHFFLSELESAIEKIVAALEADAAAAAAGKGGKDASSFQSLVGELEGKMAKRATRPLPAALECKIPTSEVLSVPNKCYTAFLPREGAGLDLLLKRNGSELGKWKSDFAEEHQVTKYFHNLNNGDYRDRKGDVSGTRELSGWIHFQLPKRLPEKGREPAARASKASNTSVLPLSKLVICQGSSDLSRLRDCDIKVDRKLWYKGKTSTLPEDPKYTTPIQPVTSTSNGEKFLKNCGLVGEVSSSDEHLLSIRGGKERLQLSHVILA